MGHDHHHHHHASVKNIKIAFFLNFAFTIVEFIGGILTNSTAILADAVHDLGDTFALGQAWYFERLSQNSANTRYTYGYKRFALLGAVISVLVLLLSSIYILSEAIPRLFEPQQAHAEGMILLALMGVAVNGFAILRLSRNEGINSKAVALHLLEDVLGWVAVLVVSVVMLFADLPILDPILAILITLYILSNVLKNIRSTIPIFLQAAPLASNIDAVIMELEKIPHVSSLHHVHLWSLDEFHAVFSAHILTTEALGAHEYSALKEQLKMRLEQFGFGHTTLEIEFPQELCRIEEGHIHP